ncbi:hypothetical protein [Streptomyces sp. DSM 40907]|uniref:hypothetical protein n=1 Tax=Streptomyces kutzneri TaxID=3051179 RepID=UPI0028D1244D|nr:hypothetical protein [Streptomyces sp. DSM 40907]
MFKGHGSVSIYNPAIETGTVPEDLRVLGNVLMDGIFHAGPAMPAALPFLIGLAAVPDIAVQPGLIDLLAVAAEVSSPVGAADERQVLFLGNDCDHPEPVDRRSPAAVLRLTLLAPEL